MTKEPFAYKPSKTYRIVVGCGNIYVTVDFVNNGFHKVRMQRTSKLLCSQALLKPLLKSVTYQTRRDMKQAIKDLKTPEVDACKQYNVTVKSAMKKNQLAAYSCSDAIARVLERLLEENNGKSESGDQ